MVLFQSEGTAFTLSIIDLAVLLFGITLLVCTVVLLPKQINKLLIMAARGLRGNILNEALPKAERMRDLIFYLKAGLNGNLLREGEKLILSDLGLWRSILASDDGKGILNRRAYHKALEHIEQTFKW